MGVHAQLPTLLSSRGRRDGQRQVLTATWTCRGCESSERVLPPRRPAPRFSDPSFSRSPPPVPRSKPLIFPPSDYGDTLWSHLPSLPHQFFQNAAQGHALPKHLYRSRRGVSTAEPRQRGLAFGEAGLLGLGTSDVSGRATACCGDSCGPWDTERHPWPLPTDTVSTPCPC